MPLPDASQRHRILKVHLRGEKLDPTSVTPASLENFSQLTEGLSGSDLFEVCREAALASLRRWLNKDGLALEDVQAPSGDGSVFNVYS